MGEILGIGYSHGPGITGPLTRLTDIYLRRNLQSELTPAHMKDPKNWPKKMQNVSDPPPPAPPPWRCYDLGKAVAEVIKQSPWRAVVIGSSSWSHASLTKKNYLLWPDVETDRQRLADLKSGEQRKWRSVCANFRRLTREVTENTEEETEERAL
ncbi:MAG: hypothetical protein FJ143_14820 [Deltaproteobacteria bacterium]|nr:hypothetical protein [Deltaproteobacteria bacterium]MBM4299006.1 hypothetical protein [Deltaproteobacteria bacterium]